MIGASRSIVIDAQVSHLKSIALIDRRPVEWLECCR